MDGELVRALYHELFRQGNLRRPRRCVYTDNLVLFVYFLGVACDRSTRWAYCKRNGPLWARHLALPSYSQIMRRLKTRVLEQRIRELNPTFRARLPRSAEKVVDGKPLVVGVHSKDPDATRGRLSNSLWARGYKLHALVDLHGPVDAFRITGLHAGEATVARELVEPLDLKDTLVRGDANYDSNPLYAAVAQRGGRFLAPRRKPGRGLGHHPQHPDRLRAIAELETDEALARQHKRHRVRVEQTFGHLTNLPFGLAPLPNWVRRSTRVANWIAAQITLYHLHLALALSRSNAA